MQAEILIHGWAWVPWLLLFPASVLLWRNTTRSLGLWGMAGGYALAAVVGQLTAPVLLPAVALAFAGWAVTRAPQNRVRLCGHVVFVATAIALRLHIAPGFHNPPALAGVLATGAVPFKAYLNLDKTLTAVWIVVCIRWLDLRGSPIRHLSLGAGLGVVAFLLVAILAVPLGVVRLEPRVPPTAWVWAVNNVLLVVFAEEVFSRGYFQGLFERWLQGKNGSAWIPIVTASLLFSASHLGQPAVMYLLDVIAGVFYGVAYRRGGLMAAISAHATLNLLHFFLMTYPFLAVGS